MSFVLSALDNIWPYLVAILLFLVIIVVHEFGHFIFAKMLGVRVNEFAVGFGPTLIKWQGKETKYSVKLIPFGGYCAMEGEDDESSDARAFCNKSAWRRFLIVAAGAVFNIILGFTLIMFYFAPATGIATNTVDYFAENASSVTTGLRAGDTILKVDGRSCLTATEIDYAFTAVKDNKIDLVVRRDGEKIELKNVEFQMDELEGIKYLKRDFAYKYAKNNFKTFFTSRLNILFLMVELFGFHLSI